ncbi:hypothetical protein A3A79_05215 [Candidatus Gottesmanbacteria bacterium RIFCSPLOWO2_01_FULL_43_11b]|uniref:Uncharacterized protein n=1 Tax=Candidatus Gottesmanbacteria bacterium RIFCSPLOWO2_01_FULL_43_11b TaxID=1798392 RepID=A0A1F6AIN0_9BACT|nr:MAG: hypothetical protein A3A79_05215 [Candidatus Gottesmanbacteria bacterium RIFCSPLOWO2_01_FULL_43_11b]
MIIEKLIIRSHKLNEFSGASFHKLDDSSFFRVSAKRLRAAEAFNTCLRCQLAPSVCSGVNTEGIASGDFVEKITSHDTIITLNKSSCFEVKVKESR